MTREEIIEISKNKGTILIEKLEKNSDLGRVPPTKGDDWLSTYLEPSNFNSLDPIKFREDIIQFISTLDIEYKLDFVVNSSICDIFLPDNRIAIKLLSLFDYSEINVNKNYQLETFNDFVEKEYKIIQIFEDTWNMKKEIVKSRLLSLMGKSPIKIYARKCEVKEIKKTTLITSFLKENHLQGSIGSKVKIGLFYNNKLVSLMTFGKLRKNLGQISSDDDYELMRLCGLLNTNIIGGASKMLKYFIKKYNPNSIISYADKCWSNVDNVYEKLGLCHVHESAPSYFYIIGQRRKGRFGYRKDVLLQAGYDPDVWTEHTIALNEGCYRIFDCGTSKYQWVKNKENKND